MHSRKGQFQTPFHSQLRSPYSFEDLHGFIGAFADVVVSHCYDLGLHELQYVRLTYLKLLTDDEDDVRFVAGSRPVVAPSPSQWFPPGWRGLTNTFQAQIPRRLDSN